MAHKVVRLLLEDFLILYRNFHIFSPKVRPRMRQLRHVQFPQRRLELWRPPVGDVYLR